MTAAVTPLGDGVDDGVVSEKWLKRYGTFLKLLGPVFMSFPVLTHIVKFGLIWHKGGDAFQFTDIEFHPYFNMIVTIYAGIGFYCLQAGYNPKAYQSMLSYIAFGATLAHGIIATIDVFAFDNRFDCEPAGGNDYTICQPNYFEGGSYDKLLVACPTWFTLASLLIFFNRSAFGKPLYPWDCAEPERKPMPQPGSEKMMDRFKLYLKGEGALFMSIWLVAHVVKWGLMWGDAGDPFNFGSGWKTHPYFLMIVTIYFVLGLNLWFAAKDPANHKSLLALTTFVYCFMHGAIATLCVFAFKGNQWGYFQGGAYDKLLVACPTWFGTCAIHLYFQKSIFGTVFLIGKE